jgi:Na+-driven multidrug efflux pump
MVWITITLALFAAFLGLLREFFRLLRTNHPDLYRELGEPSLLPKDPFSMDLRAARFLWGGAYRDLGDARLSRLGTLLRLYVIGFAVWIFHPLFR